MKRLIRGCIRLLPMIAILLLGVEIIVANELAGLGDDLATVNASVDQARAVNEELATQVASSSSLLAVREKAYVLGFHEPTKQQTLVFNPSELPVALTNSVR